LFDFNLQDFGLIVKRKFAAILKNMKQDNITLLDENNHSMCK